MNATEADIDRAFSDDRIRGEFIILTAPNGDFMQAAGDGDGPFTLEHRSAGGEHIQGIGDCSKEEVREAFVAFLRNDDRWRTERAWRSLGDARDEVDVCERCGREAAGRRRWMIYGELAWLFGEGIQREFFCFRCLRVMRVYAIIGFSLLAIVIAAIVGFTLWLTMGGP